MADDWKAGDLAVCVQDVWFRAGIIPTIVAPRKEQVLRVAGVKRDRGACACGECDTALAYTSPSMSSVTFGLLPEASARCAPTALRRRLAGRKGYHGSSAC